MKMLSGMLKQAILPITAICACAVLAAMPAKADLKITMQSSMSGPMMQNLPPQAKAQMGSMMQSTTYVSGKKYRVNTAIVSVILDPGNNKMTMINDNAKTYSVMPFSAAAASAMMQNSAGGGMQNAPGASSQVLDTGKTTTFLGHKVRHYVVTTEVSLGGMGAMTVHSDILAAQDLPAADSAVFNSLQAAVQGKTHVVGVPLKTITTITGGPMGNMTTTQEATSISTAPVPASDFSIPSGYTQSQNAMPGMPPPPAQ